MRPRARGNDPPAGTRPHAMMVASRMRSPASPWSHRAATSARERPASGYTIPRHDGRQSHAVACVPVESRPRGHERARGPASGYTIPRHGGRRLHTVTCVPVGVTVRPRARGNDPPAGTRSHAMMVAGRMRSPASPWSHRAATIARERQSGTRPHAMMVAGYMRSPASPWKSPDGHDRAGTTRNRVHDPTP